jgi:hypothetical protein
MTTRNRRPQLDLFAVHRLPWSQTPSRLAQLVLPRQNPNPPDWLVLRAAVCTQTHTSVKRITTSNRCGTSCTDFASGGRDFFARASNVRAHVLPISLTNWWRVSGESVVAAGSRVARRGRPPVASARYR